MNEQELEQKYMEFQFLSQQYEQVQQQMQVIAQQIAELQSIDENLNNLEKLKKNKKMWVPLGGGMFIPSISSEDYSKVLMNVGNNVYLKKTVKDSKKLIAEQLNAMQENLGTYEEAFVKLQNKILEMQKLFQ